MNEDCEQDWVMPLGNSQKTNSLVVKKPADLEGLVIVLDSISIGEYMSGKLSVICRAYDYQGRQEWKFEKEADWDSSYFLRIHNNNILLVDKDKFDKTVEIDSLTGQKIRTVDFHPEYVWRSISINKKGNGIKLIKYPSGETIYEKNFPESGHYDTEEYKGLLGIVDGKAVVDYGHKILIIDLKKPNNYIERDKKIGEDEIFKLVNIDEDGIVGSYYSKNAPHSMDDSKFGGKKEGAFSSLVYMGFDGEFKFEPVEFGLHVYPKGMAMLNGKVYLEIGQREMYHGDTSSLYCFDLRNRKDLWSRKFGWGAIPTRDLVYIDNGKMAVNEYGEEVWKIEGGGIFTRLLDISVTRDYVVRHIENYDWSTKEYFIQVLDRFNGREVANWQIKKSYEGRMTPDAMICADFS